MLSISSRPFRQLAFEAGLIAANCWGWWISEIHNMLPARLVPQDRVTVEVTDDQIYVVEEGLRGRRLSKTEAMRGGVVLQIDRQHVLRRTLQLPMSARFGLRKILANDLERQSPIDPGSVLFTYRIISMDRAAGRISVSLVLIRRKEIETGIARLHASGLRVRAIRAGNVSDQPKDDLSAPQTESFRLGSHDRILTALLVFLFFICATDAYMRFEKTQAQIAALAGEENNLEVAARQASVIRGEIEAEQRFDNFLIAQRSQPPLGAILAEITERLPDGTWLYSLNYDGRQIEMQGFSTNASNLVPNFDESRLFTNANFRAPMTQGPNPALQQFDLAMSLTENAK